MSEENVEVARQAIAAWNAGDMERLRELYAPDAIARPLAGAPERGPFVGRDEIMGYFGRLRDAFDRDSIHVSDYRSIGDRVVVLLAWKAAGHGPAIDTEVAFLYTIRGGRVLELETFRGHDEALKAAGLSE
jgi:ketosteroid isomerase-like protein